MLALIACTKGNSSTSDASAPAASSTISSWPIASGNAEPGASKPGMAFIPAGSLVAGTAPNKTPRVADEEMPGTAIDMGGFYIDLLPWPNEPNAIPTTNIGRDEAEQLCESKQKRLCTELEWERACKGADNTTYEYGDAYRKEPCGTGLSEAQASHRPTGEHAQCKSSFGVMEMHGGVWEWTASSWGRGSKDASQGVLRGGNSVAGELVGRCANAIARDPSKKAPTMGFRCCSGPKGMAEVHLDVSGTPALQMNGKAVPDGLATLLGGDVDPKTLHAWDWVPIPNEDLTITLGCTSAPTVTARTCGLVVGRATGDALASATTGRDPPEVQRAGDFRHLRMRSLDVHGTFSREITYVYGRVELGDPKRP